MALKIGHGASAPPFLVMDVISRANAHQAALAASPDARFSRVIRMEVGQPGTPAPAGARTAVAAALGSGAPLGYTEAFGIPALRARIAAHIQDWYGVAVPMGRIAVTVGASGAFPLAFLAAFNPGDRIALAAPFYPPYVNILTALGMQPVILPTGPETRFQPTVALLAALDPPPDGLIVASPCNPAGTMLHPDELAAIATWCHQNGVRLISDEIYHGLHYDSPLASAAADSDSAIVINSFSKYFSMTGWRVGWMVLPEDLIRPVECLAQNMFISAPHISQIAALAAFECGAELQANVARYRRSRDRLLTGLPQAGFDRLGPAEGAFYLYAEIDEDSLAFCARLLEDCAIAIAPGVDFDRTRGHHTIRFSYCGPEEDIAEAVQRLCQR
jgi:aspartate/methionine/tyrosine aminotransferase